MGARVQDPARRIISAGRCAVIPRSRWAKVSLPACRKSLNCSLLVGDVTLFSKRSSCHHQKATFNWLTLHESRQKYKNRFLPLPTSGSDQILKEIKDPYLISYKSSIKVSFTVVGSNFYYWPITTPYSQTASFYQSNFIKEN